MMGDYDPREAGLAKAAAKLDHPEKLVKVEQLLADATRNLDAIETQLRGLVQSQLEDARTGLELLNRSKEAVAHVRGHFLQIDALHSQSQQLFPDYEKVRMIEKVRRNLKSTLKDIALLKSVESKIVEVQEMFNDNTRLLDVHREVRQLVRLREAFLKKTEAEAPQALPTISRVLEGVVSLSQRLNNVMSTHLAKFLGLCKSDPAAIVRVLRIVEREEAMSRKQPEAGAERMNRQWALDQLGIFIESRFDEAKARGSTLEERLALFDFVVADLIRVADYGVRLFPPDYKIFEWMVHQYHSRVADFIHEALDHAHALQTPQILALVAWTSSYHTQLAQRLDTASLEQPLERLDTQCEVLLDQYVAEARQNTAKWLKQMLRLHLTKRETVMENDIIYAVWTQDLFQLVKQQIDLAAVISKGVPLQQIARMCGDAMVMFVQAWLVKLQATYKDIELPYIIALANSALRSMDYARDEVARVKAMIRDDLKDSLSYEAAVDAFHQLSRAAVAVAVDVMFADCEQVLGELFTKTWLEQKLIGSVAATLRSYFEDLKYGMNQHLFNKIVGDSLDYLLSIYLEALLTKTNFKITPQVVRQFEADFKTLEELFTQFATRPKLISKKLQVLKELREMMVCEPSVIAVPFATVLNLHPDFTVEVVSRILQSRTDLDKAGRAEALEACKTVYAQMGAAAAAAAAASPTPGVFERILHPSKAKDTPPAEKRGLFRNLFAAPTMDLSQDAAAAAAASVEVVDLDEFLGS